MRFNPSLTARLRIGFLVLFALLLLVSLLGVGRLFQVRVNYEDDITRYFQLELESERLRSAFILEQAATRPASTHQPPSQAGLNRASASFSDAVDHGARCESRSAGGQRGGLAAGGGRAAGSREDPTGTRRAPADLGRVQQQRGTGSGDARRA